MRWSKLKKIIIEHPYLISDDFHMSISEAKRIQKEEGFTSFEEMVENARKRSSFPDSALEEVYTAIEKHKEKANVEPKERKVFPNPFMRRWAIVGLCVLLLTGYLTLVPSGRALAASIVKIIVEVFNDGFLFTPAATPETSQGAQGIEQTQTVFADFDEAQAFTQRPLLQLDNEAFQLDKVILYDNGVAGNLLAAAYKTPDGLNITLLQKWNMHGTPWFEVDTSITWEETLWDGETTLHCFIDAADNDKFTATGVWNDVIVIIYAGNGIPYEDIISSLHAST